MTQRVEFSIRVKTTLPKRLDEHSEEEFDAVLENLAFDLQPSDCDDEVTIVDWREV